MRRLQVCTYVFSAMLSFLLCLLSWQSVYSLPVAHASACRDIDVSFARGTNESSGLGEVGDEFLAAVEKRLDGAENMRVDSYGVEYPASFDFLQAGTGADDLSTHLQKRAAQCPKTRFVVGGYAQGAAVVDILLGTVPLGFYGFTKPLPEGLDGRIDAIALFGDPKNIRPPGVVVDLGIRNELLSKVVDVCNPGDFFCDPQGGGILPHSTYATNRSVEPAADFVVKQLIAKLGNGCGTRMNITFRGEKQCAR